MPARPNKKGWEAASSKELKSHLLAIRSELGDVRVQAHSPASPTPVTHLISEWSAKDDSYITEIIGASPLGKVELVPVFI